MTLSSTQPSSKATGDPEPVSDRPILPLDNGDRLTRDEFERRYHAMTEVKKAELIEGTVYMPSPVRMRKHGQPHITLATWVGLYHLQTPGVLAADNTTIRLDLDNEPQPDLLLLIDPAAGGQAKISDDDYIEGAPELVAEVAGSTAALDLHAKLNAYRRNGVKEYIVWVTGENEVHWYVARESRFDLLPPDADGITRSVVFPGLWLDGAALLKGDMPKVLEVARAGVASEAHAAFAEKLKGAAKGS